MTFKCPKLRATDCFLFSYSILLTTNQLFNHPTIDINNQPTTKKQCTPTTNSSSMKPNLHKLNHTLSM